MITTHFRRLLPVLALVYGGLVTSSVGALTNELSRLKGIYAAETAKVEAKYAAMQTNAPDQYLQALDALEKTYQQKGDLKSVMAVRTERKQFNRETVAPGADADGAPTELKTLKANLRAMPAELDGQKKRETAALNAAYLNRLEALQRDLTKQGQIEVAVGMQAEIDNARAGREPTSHGVGEAQTTEPTPRPSPKIALEPENLAPRTSPEEGLSPLGGQSAPRQPLRSTTVRPVQPVSPPDYRVPSAAISGAVLTGTQADDSRSLEAGQTYVVDGVYFVPEGTQLAIQPGVSLRFLKGASLTIGGTLEAVGSAAAPIRFVGQGSGAGYWKGVSITGKTVSQLAYVEVKGAETAVFMNNGKAEIKSCRVTDNVVGIKTDGRGVTAVVMNSLIANNEQHGVWVHFSAVHLTSCTISRNGGFGVWGSYYPLPTLDRCIVSDNKGGGIRGGGYDGVVTAHDCVVIGNKGIDVEHLCDKDWDFSRCWWGEANTRKLRQSDTANLTCIVDALDGKSKGRVRVDSFLEALPQNCGANIEGALAR